MTLPEESNLVQTPSATHAYAHEPNGVPSVRILITGATGMIGHALRAACAARNVEAVPLQRAGQPPASPKAIFWQPQASQPFEDLEQLEDFDAVVHLAGANLSGKRWTPEYKKVIRESRTETTGALSLALARLQNPPRVLLSTSATGFYGSRGDEVLTEASALGKGFLAGTCEAWEMAAAPAVAAGIRVVHPRFGVVLTPEGGALKQMLPLFRLGMGGNLGNGKEWMSWITLDDLLNALFFCMQQESLSGAVNFVSPEPVRNSEFTKALGGALHRPAVLPAPAFALRLAFGQMADEALLSSCRAVPAKLQAAGFAFRSPSIEPALKTLLG
jgi:uncharacterized protein (TIGR01777 family)